MRLRSVEATINIETVYSTDHHLELRHSSTWPSGSYVVEMGAEGVVLYMHALRIQAAIANARIVVSVPHVAVGETIELELEMDDGDDVFALWQFGDGDEQHLLFNGNGPRFV